MLPLTAVGGGGSPFVRRTVSAPDRAYEPHGFLNNRYPRGNISDAAGRGYRGREQISKTRAES